MNDKEMINQLLDLNDEEKLNLLLFYYRQGLEIGKEEASYEIANKMIDNNIDKELVSHITSIDIVELS